MCDLTIIKISFTIIKQSTRKNYFKNILFWIYDTFINFVEYTRKSLLCDFLFIFLFLPIKIIREVYYTSCIGWIASFSFSYIRQFIVLSVVSGMPCRSLTFTCLHLITTTFALFLISRSLDFPWSSNFTTVNLTQPVCETGKPFFLISPAESTETGVDL